MILRKGVEEVIPDISDTCISAKANFSDKPHN
jgi:hypothetical protein